MSSINEIKKNRIKIFGRKTITSPTPPITPFTIKSLKGPSVKLLLISLESAATPASIQSIGYSPNTKVA